MMTPPAPSPLPDRLRFGRFELRPHEHRLLADGEPVALGGRAFDLLLVLARRPGELLTRNELIEQVWPGRVVEENNLSVQVNALRKALGDEWLATVPGRGYRFVAPLADAAGPAAAPPQPEPATPLPHTHLPTRQPLLIGRSDDLAALGTLVDQHRLVTIVGAGGMGKTRLAQALLQMRVTSYPQGVCWIELGSVATPDALPGAVAAALGLSGGPGHALAPLARAAAGLQMLLALDNAEHLLDAVASLAQALLDAAPGLRLVVTSQAPLRLSAERVLRLGPLAVPQGPLPARQAQAFGAVALFCDRAAAADHRFVLKDADVPAVIELCRGLDGVALAIELAAARAPALGIAGLQATLADRLRVLSSTRDRLAPARQQSLRAALEWSFALLAPAEQRLFRRVAVLAGSGSLALVRRVGTADGGADDPSWEVVDALDQLVQRSLVEVINDDELGPPRYRLLESPRALALEQLRASGEEAAVRLRHARGVLADFDAADAALQAGRLGLQARRRLRALDLPNAREALLQARQSGLAELELALSSGVLAVAPHDERLQLAERCERLIAAQVQAAPLDADRVYRAWRAISHALANLQPARSLAAAREALVLARRLDEAPAERLRLYDTLCTVAHMLTDEDHGRHAEPLLREAQALASPDWPPMLLRAGLRVEASLETVRGRAREALALYRRLLDLDRAAGESGLTTLLNIANAELASGDAAAAVATGQRLVEQLRDPRSAPMLMHARINLAAAQLALDDTAAARVVVQQVLGVVPRPRIAAWCVDVFALLAAQEGRHEAAARLLGAADARYEATADQRQVNEQRAHERTLALLGGMFDASALAALRDAGRSLADAEVAQFALAGA